MSGSTSGRLLPTAVTAPAAVALEYLVIVALAGVIIVHHGPSRAVRLALR